MTNVLNAVNAAVREEAEHLLATWTDAPDLVLDTAILPGELTSARWSARVGARAWTHHVKHHAHQPGWDTTPLSRQLAAAVDTAIATYLDALGIDPASQASHEIQDELADQAIGESKAWPRQIGGS